GEEGDLELQAQATDPGAARVDRGKASGDRNEARDRMASQRRLAAGADDRLAERLDNLIEEAAEVAAALFEAVEDRDALDDVARGERIDEARDRLAIGEAEQLAHPALIERRRRRGQELVQHRLGG